MQNSFTDYIMYSHNINMQDVDNLQTYLLSFDRMRWIKGPTLPFNIDRGCALALNRTAAIILQSKSSSNIYLSLGTYVGSFNFELKFALFNFDQNAWIVLPSLNIYGLNLEYISQKTSCTLIENKSGSL